MPKIQLLRSITPPQEAQNEAHVINLATTALEGLGGLESLDGHLGAGKVLKSFVCLEG